MVGLLPREEVFFALFTQAAENTLQAARQLKAMLERYEQVPEQAAAIKAAEERGDEIIHQITDRLNRTFITPLDREDIHALARQLDNVIDWIEAVAARLVDYRVTQPTPAAVELAHIIVHMAEAMVEAVRNLRRLDRVEGQLEEIHRLENLADHVHRQAIARLFAENGQPLEVIKWKDIYETLERATDQAEDVADVLAAIRAKRM
jgi:predicted phosphate transport protein (TIGR00153 family)